MKTMAIIFALATVIFAAPALADHNRTNDQGQKVGHWTEVTAYGGYVSEGRYVDGKEHGHWVWRGFGFVHEGPYVDGKKHGHWVLRFADGDVQEGPFVDGKQHGQWVHRTANGEVTEICFENDKVVC